MQRAEPAASGEEPVIDIGPRREAVANATIAAVALLSLAAIAVKAELYPFSPYPMFSRSRADVTEFKRVFYVGVADGREVELSKAQVRAFTRSRKGALDRWFRRLGRAGDPRSARRLAAALLGLYERWRPEAGEELPRLDALRIYEYRWQLEPRARNRERPDERRLMAEYRRGEPLR